MSKNDNKSIMKAPKQELINNDELERTRERLCYVPKADIYETNEKIIVTADIQGVNKETIDITLEKNILTINAFVEDQYPSDYRMVYGEYEAGDYQRSFRLSSEVDQDKIEAVVSNGELRLYLPKAEVAKTKKIKVKAG